ncbi:hypothetical protein [Methylomonas sp. UP202]|uniref:hypothetical protein n=1 Tax=Methylomonas sp. UP202 TaxID=3040943 RepID=UPI00247A2D84|nr:hypothetical protein [Methylomonas sp. UP202]WGS86694.1 hypothetical protein QC632_02785 [Methylomonas sp. UP202]
MHSLSTYSIRCCNPGLPVKERYYALDKIGQNDLFKILETFIKSNTGSLSKNKELKQTYSFSDITFDNKNRKIYGFFNVGNFGIANEIIDSDTNKTVFTKTVNCSDVIKHYFQFHLPVGYDEGFCIFYIYRGNGIKTLFYDAFEPMFKSATTFTLQMKPLGYDKAFQEWAKANVKELKVNKFSSVPDPADIPRYKGHIEGEAILKPGGKLTSFGIFSNFNKKGTDENALVEYLSGFGSQVKAVVKVGNKKRTFSVGVNESNPVCQIEFDDNDVAISDGMPAFDSIHKFANDIIKEYVDNLYKSPKKASP